MPTSPCPDCEHLGVEQKREVVGSDVVLHFRCRACGAAWTDTLT